ncbi:MAG: response regulator transcription factor [Bacteroidales bacterium]|nr:response regulator transcription factor [Bacteroidales bacterium]
MMEPIKILFAEDDVNLAKVLMAYLTEKGYAVSHATNGEIAYELFCQNTYDICLIDVMMPLMDGFTLAQEIRKVDRKIPIIFLTAKSLQEDMIKGLSIGGDDYITKPFPRDVLLARIQALLRRTVQTEEDNGLIQLTDSIVFDKKRQLLTVQGVEKKITTREVELLQLLIEKKNDVLERGYALKKIWGDDSWYNSRNMDVYINKLRKLFKEDASIQIINVHGVGFKLII